MTREEWIYDSMMGTLVTPCPEGEDAFAEGIECERLYREIYEASIRLSQRLGTGEEDGDVEIIINNFFP